MRLLVLDVDGVMTDGRLDYDAGGERSKTFHVRDGHGLRAVMAAGITVAVVSGRPSLATQRRCSELGIRHIHLGVDDKGAVLARIMVELGIDPAQCTCIGDDAPDVPMLRLAGLAVTVADAHASARAVAHRRTRLRGGQGAVREVCDWLLAARR